MKFQGVFCKISLCKPSLSWKKGLFLFPLLSGCFAYSLPVAAEIKVSENQITFSDLSTHHQDIYLYAEDDQKELEREQYLLESAQIDFERRSQDLYLRAEKHQGTPLYEELIEDAREYAEKSIQKKHEAREVRLLAQSVNYLMKGMTGENEASPFAAEILGVKKEKRDEESSRENLLYDLSIVQNNLKIAKIQLDVASSEGWIDDVITRTKEVNQYEQILEDIQEEILESDATLSELEADLETLGAYSKFSLEGQQAPLENLTALSDSIMSKEARSGSPTQLLSLENLKLNYSSLLAVVFPSDVDTVLRSAPLLKGLRKLDEQIRELEANIEIVEQNETDAIKQKKPEEAKRWSELKRGMSSQLVVLNNQRRDTLSILIGGVLLAPLGAITSAVFFLLSRKYKNNIEVLRLDIIGGIAPYLVEEARADFKEKVDSIIDSPNLSFKLIMLKLIVLLIDAVWVNYNIRVSDLLLRQQASASKSNSDDEHPKFIDNDSSEKED